MPRHKQDRLELAGWRFEPRPRRTMARLKHPDGSTTYIDAESLLTAPEYMSRLSDADRREVQEMSMQRGAAA